MKTSTGETARDDELLEDLWPNLNAMVTRNMVSIAISGLVLRVTAQRSCVECTWNQDRRCLIRDCVRRLPFQLVWKICHARHTCEKHGGRRVAQLEHNISDDKDIWSDVVEGSKWIGVSAFHLSVAVTPLVMRTGKGRETGTGHSKPHIQPKRRPRDVSWIHPPSGTWRETETPQAHWNWDEHQRQETRFQGVELGSNCSAETVT